MYKCGEFLHTITWFFLSIKHLICRITIYKGSELLAGSSHKIFCHLRLAVPSQKRTTAVDSWKPGPSISGRTDSNKKAFPLFILFSFSSSSSPANQTKQKSQKNILVVQFRFDSTKDQTWPQFLRRCSLNFNDDDDEDCKYISLLCNDSYFLSKVTTESLAVLSVSGILRVRGLLPGVGGHCQSVRRPRRLRGLRRRGRWGNTT